MQFSLLINTFKITCAGLPGNASTYSATKVCTLSFLHSVFTPNCTFSGLYDNCGNKRKDFSDLCRRGPRRYDCVHPFNSFFYRSQSIPSWSWIGHKLFVRGCDVFWDILYIQTFFPRHTHGDRVGGVYIQILCFCIRYKPLACFARGDFSR